MAPMSTATVAASAAMSSEASATAASGARGSRRTRATAPAWAPPAPRAMATRSAATSAALLRPPVRAQALVCVGEPPHAPREPDRRVVVAVRRGQLGLREDALAPGLLLELVGDLRDDEVRAHVVDQRRVVGLLLGGEQLGLG